MALDLRPARQVGGKAVRWGLATSSGWVPPAVWTLALHDTTSDVSSSRR